MALYQVLYWKDIPAQLRVFRDIGRPMSRQMPPQFQQAIDARAMREGLAGTDDYLAHWHWTEKIEREGSAEEVAEMLVRELEQAQSRSAT